MMRIPAVAFGTAALLILMAQGEDTTSRLSERIDAAIAEQAKERAQFIALRNAEIEFSLAACERRRSNEFAAARNAEIAASMAAVDQVRLVSFAAARNAEIDMVVAASEAQWMVQFAEARNTELAAAQAHYFAAERNAEIDKAAAASEAQWMVRFAEARSTELAAAQAQYFAEARNAEIETASLAAEAERMRAFAEARNAEIETAMTTAETTRSIAFADARNAEIETAMATVETTRLIAFAEARNSEIETAMTAVETHRFAAARNREIELAMSTHELQRATLAAGGRLGRITVALGSGPTAGEVIETGSVGTAAATPGARACRGLVEGLAAVEFARSGAELDATGKRAIDELARIASTCAGSIIEIHGHTDTSGTTTANKRLSERRARAVADELIKSGIDAGRLEVIGHGATAPIAPNTTAENRARNRRIEFTLKDKTVGTLIEVR